MAVRAKFKVESITPTSAEGGATIVMYPVYGGGDPEHENTKFFQYTPSGRIEIGTVNVNAVKQFEVGKEYYIDFTPAE